MDFVQSYLYKTSFIPGGEEGQSVLASAKNCFCFFFPLKSFHHLPIVEKISSTSPQAK